MIVERRSLTRRTSLEDHVQTAIDTVRADVIDEAVADVLARIDTVPADMRHRAIKAARQSLADALLGIDKDRQAQDIQTRWSAGKSKARAAAHAVFGAVQQAVDETGDADEGRAVR